MEFSVLGPLEVRDDGRPLPLGGTRKRALLAVLLLNANRPISIERLVDALWGERPPPTATTTVHVYISQLRKQLGRERLTTSQAGYVLEVGADELDRSRFERFVAGARLAADPAERAALLREALSLWRGPALEDLRYEPAAELEAERLDEERLTALEERIDADLQLGLHERVVGELEQLPAAHPLRERLREQLMLALYRSGRQGDALDVYRDSRRLLGDELGIEPGPGLRRLEQSILNHDPALGAETDLSAPARRRDEGSKQREERKVVTVVFCDIAGFTRRAEELDPEDVRRLLRRFHEPVRAELERFGGTVEKFIGDAVMAVFGAPVAHEDDAERAVRAAFAVRDAVRRACVQEEGLDLDLRIGVNTGEALAVIDADLSAGEGLVAGDVVNTAARLQASARVNTIVVGEATHRATATAIRYRERRPVAAKGKARPVLRWEAVDALVPLGTQPDRTRRGPFVGRTRERQLIDDALARARRDRRVEIVTVVGEPGIGKSRLVSELAAPAAGPTWLTGRCLPYGGEPYVALAQMVRKCVGIAEGDSAAVASLKLDQAVPDQLPEAKWVRGHLRLLVGLETDARGERRELFAAWRRFFEEKARDGAVLVFEDVHWAGDGQLDFLESLADWARGPLLVLCTARPELLDRRPSWPGALTLLPLTDRETADLLATLVGDRELPPGLLARIGGNPLFAEEFARSLEHGGDLVMPESIQATIAARIDLLPTSEKNVLHAAAVFGKSFPPSAVARLADATLDRVLTELESLEHRALMRRADEADFAFGHILIRDVAYGQVSRSRRAEQHRHAAEWLEEDPGRGDDRIDALAYHYTTALDLAVASRLDVGELPQRALVWLTRAGERSLRLHAYREALDSFERARARRRLACPRRVGASAADARPPRRGTRVLRGGTHRRAGSARARPPEPTDRRELRQ
jgi:DNA-binding SARP family transcriptional activator